MMREMIPRVYGGVGRRLLISWFGGHFLMIRGVLFILGSRIAQDKKRAGQVITILNQQLEPIRKAKWEFNTSMARLKLRNGRAPGRAARAPVWKWNKKNGLLYRNSRGDVDWC
jgi:hypothetical protein